MQKILKKGTNISCAKKETRFDATPPCAWRPPCCCVCQQEMPRLFWLASAFYNKCYANFDWLRLSQQMPRPFWCPTFLLANVTCSWLRRQKRGHEDNMYSTMISWVWPSGDERVALNAMTSDYRYTASELQENGYVMTLVRCYSYTFALCYACVGYYFRDTLLRLRLMLPLTWLLSK